MAKKKFSQKKYRRTRLSKREEKIISKVIDDLNHEFDKSHRLHRKYRSVESVYNMLVEKSIAYKKDVALAQLNLSRKYEIKKTYYKELVAMTIGGLSANAYCFGTSHRIVNNPAPELSSRLNKLGLIGTKSPLPDTTNVIGKCAEVKAANGLLSGSTRLSLNDIRFTAAIRPRTLEKKPRCANCRNVFGAE